VVVVRFAGAAGFVSACPGSNRPPGQRGAVERLGDSAFPAAGHFDRRPTPAQLDLADALARQAAHLGKNFQEVGFANLGRELFEMDNGHASGASQVDKMNESA